MVALAGQLTLSGLAVVLAGYFLARCGDVLGERTRLGGMWAGMVLLALATSLPELAAGITAVRLGAHDLAAGNLFGSSLANLLILALLDLASRDGVLRRASLEHVPIGLLAIVLNALAAVFSLLRTPVALGPVSLASLALVGLYALGARAMYLRALRERGGAAAASAPGSALSAARAPTWLAALGFALAAGLTFLAAPHFASGAERLAEVSGLGETFIGTLLVGLATSLPELAASWAAVRLGAVDLAVGNVLGSNAINMTLFLAYDLAYPAGSWFARLGSLHGITALLAVALMAFAISGIVFRVPKRLSLGAPSGLTLLLGYAAAITTLYLAGP